MSHLSKALGKYYEREGNKILFRNKQSLNQLAVALWEQLGYQQIDASVLSRILKGERLFTPLQLKTFCQHLAIPKKEEEYLQSCLQQDHNARLSLYTGTTPLSASLTREIITELTFDAFDKFYKGNYGAIEKRYDMIQQLAQRHRMSNQGDRAVGEAVGLSFYLQGRTMANGELPSRVIQRIYPVYSQLLSTARTYRSSLLQGYAHVLKSNMYYLAGGYSNSATKRKLYSASIQHAKQAIETLPETDHEGLFAHRLIAASASYIHDNDSVRYVLKRTREIIPKQPKDNYINALHLSMTVSKSLAAAKMPNPFSTQEFTAKYFKRSLANTGVYEVSGIKEEIDTLLLLRAQDKNYIRSRAQEGFELAKEFNFSRQKRYFNKLLRTI